MYAHVPPIFNIINTHICLCIKISIYEKVYEQESLYSKISAKGEREKGRTFIFIYGYTLYRFVLSEMK